MECSRIVSYLLVFTIASGKDIQRTPALLLVGKETDGEILKCNLDNPEKCEVFYSDPSERRVLSTVVRGEYLYASYLSSEILRCELYTKHSCIVFYKSKRFARCLAAVSEYLYAGFLDGTLLRCKLNQPNTCSNFHSFDDPVRSIFEYGKYIYVATLYSLSYCQKDVPFSCSEVTVNEYLFQVAHTGSIMIVIDPWNNYVTSYTLTSTNALIRIERLRVSEYLYSITVLKRIMYVLTMAGDIKTCQADKECNFKDLVRHENACSISTLYSVHHMRNDYMPKDSCNQESGPLAVFNYDVERRAMLEVSVVDGVLCDARGAAVDTRRADRGHFGRAAVFAMGPDGQLLLSHAHRSGLVHISSLFAGHPVAGAGEIVIEDGVVKRIIACSLYYLPDVTLNRQVVDELISKGYDSDRAEEISLEECVYTCNREISDEL